MKKRDKLYILLSLILSYPTLAVELEHYEVKVGDTLIHFLLRNNMKPVYGFNGSLNNILKLNPIIRKRDSNGDFLMPGEKIFFEPHAPQKANIEVAEIEIKPEAIKVEDSFLSNVIVSFSQSYVRIVGEQNNNTNGTLASSISPALNLIWSPQAGQKGRLDFGFHHQNIDFTESSARNLQSKSQKTGKVFLGGHYQLIPTFALEARIGYGDEIFYRAIDTNTIKIEKVAIPFAQLGLRYDFLRNRSNTFAIKGAYKIHSAFNNDYFKAGIGRGHYASLISEQHLNSLSIIGEAFYSNDFFPVETINFSRDEVGIAISLRFQLGAGRQTSR